MSKYKVGDKFTLDGSSTRAEIISVHEGVTSANYWLISGRTYLTRPEESLSTYWTKVEPFFIPNKKYKVRDTCMEIKEVYRPAGVPVAVAISEGGFMYLLYPVDFINAELVKE